jgi:nucleoside-diphosphate-sugar epimerase
LLRIQPRDTDDVAKCHVLALDQGKVKGNERYLTVSNETLELRKIVDKLKQELPELAGRLPTFEERNEALKLATVDLKKGNAVFGTAWKSAYESVKATVEDVLRWEKENGALQTK